MSGISISRASYGVGSQTIDVTRAVTSHIQDGNLSLVVTPAALNVEDPAVGQVKTLTVDYTINGGITNTTSGKDGDTVSVRAPPSRQSDGLRILKAQYGYPGNYTDVTDALSTLVTNGTVDLTVSHSALGIADPNPSKKKNLQVDYQINGSSSSQSIMDGNKFQLSAPPIEAVDNKTPVQHAVSFFGILVRNLAIFVMVYLHSVSVFTAIDFGYTFISPYVWGILAFFIPFFSFWALPPIVFMVRVFSSQDLI